MKQAPLQLIDYWSTYLHVEANPDYDPEQAQPVPLDSLDVNAVVSPGAPLSDPEKQGTEWELQLTIEQTLCEEIQLPYFFKLVMQGALRASPNIPEERLERAVRANGPTMLFGAAREVLRASTSRGPFRPVFLPSTNFLSELPPLVPQEGESQTTAAKNQVKAKKVASKRAKKKSS